MARSIHRQPVIILLIVLFPGKIGEKPRGKQEAVYFPVTI
jgi:hypothetical protein